MVNLAPPENDIQSKLMNPPWGPDVIQLEVLTGFILDDEGQSWKRQVVWRHINKERTERIQFVWISVIPKDEKDWTIPRLVIRLEPSPKPREIHEGRTDEVLHFLGLLDQTPMPSPTELTNQIETRVALTSPPTDGDATRLQNRPLG